MSQATDKADRAIAHANAVFNRLDARGGAAGDAARRERQRLNRDFGSRLARIGIAVGVISLVTVIVGLIVPIGMFGFLAAVGIAIGVAALFGFMPAGNGSPAPPSADLPNGEMVQRFDSYLYRNRPALPPPAQQEVDRISALLPSLKQVLQRIDSVDPAAQDARRLMSIHLPGLIDRYEHVPAAYRSQEDGEGITVDERLVEGLSASREALEDVARKIARNDLAAFETQGRFIKSRYGEEPIDR